MVPYGTTITDVDIPFGRTIVLMLRWMAASLIASLIMAILFAAIAFLLSLAFGRGLTELLQNLPR